jgi:hypothetical protein
MAEFGVTSLYHDRDRRGLGRMPFVSDAIPEAHYLYYVPPYKLSLISWLESFALLA